MWLLDCSLYMRESTLMTLQISVAVLRKFSHTALMGTQKQITNAQHQAAFRERQKAAGAQRLNVWVAGAAYSLLKHRATRDGVSLAKLLERLALEARAFNQQEKP